MNTKDTADTAKKLLKITSILLLAIIFVYLVQYAYAKFVISSNKNITLNFYEYRIQTSEIKIEPEEYTAGNVIVTITGSESNLQIEYQIGEQGEWVTYTEPFEIEENTTINARYVTDGFEGPVTSKIIENMVVGKIGNTTYETLQEAVTASADSTQTEITLLADTQEKITIPANKDIVLNTNGKTLTSEGKTITNNGKLKITGNGSVTVTESATAAYATLEEMSVAVANSSLEGLKGVGTYAASETLVSKAIIDNYGDLELSGATLKSEVSYGIVNEESGTIKITSGKVEPYKHPIYNLGSANTEQKPAVKIEGGELITGSNVQGIFHNGTGLVYMTGGKIKAQNHGIRNSVAGAKTIVEGGIIISVGETGITNMVAGGTIEVRGGIIIGKSTGVGRGADGIITISGGVIIGEDNDGLTTGSNTETNKSYYYGGTLIGASGKSIYGTLSEKKEGYEIQKINAKLEDVLASEIYKEIEDELDNKTKIYEIATLVIGNYKNVTSGIYYESLNVATKYSVTGSTIDVINNKIETVQSIIEKEKTLTINLNDKTITLTNTDIFNKGKLTVTGGENGKITSTKRVITNGSNGIDTPEENTTAVFIKEGACTFEGTGTGSSTIVNYAIATVKSGNVDSKEYRALYNAGRATIEGGKLTGKNYSVYNSGTENTCLETNPSENPALKITGGEIYSNGNVSLYNDSEGEVYITGGTISQGVANSAIYNKKTGIIHINGGVINHTGTGGSGIGNAVNGTVRMRSGEIKSTTRYGIYNVEKGNIDILGGTVSGIKYGIENQGAGTINVSGGTVTATTYAIFNKSTGTINVSGGTVKGNNGIWNHAAVDDSNISNVDSTGTINVTGGNVIGTGNIAIRGYAGTVNISGTASGTYIEGQDYGVAGGRVNKTMTITGGTIIAKKQNPTYGYAVSAGAGTTIIGVNDGSVKTDNPVIQSTKRGINVAEGGTLKLYDGKVTGTANSSIVGNVAEKPNGYIVYKTTENGKETAILSTNVLLTYDVNYLSSDILTTTTDLSKYSYYKTNAKSKVVVENENAKYGQQINFTMNEGTGGMCYSTTTLTVGETYTWSVYVKANRTITMSALGHEQGGTNQPTITTEWKRYTKTFTASDNTYHSMLFYASWQDGDEILIHSLELMEGKPEYETKTIPYGKDLTFSTSSNALAEPTGRTGYVFDGWYTAPVGGTEITSDTILPDGNTTYYAHWVVDKAASTTIGTTKTYYDTVQEAVNAAGTSQATVKLLKDVSEELTIASGQNIILNTNGKTITSTGTTITNNGTLKLTGSGNITGTGAYDANNIGSTATISNYGSFELVGATIKSDNSTGVINCENGRTIITSGNIEGYKQAIRNKGILNTEENPAVVINGGVLISNGGNTVNNATDAGLIIINGGTISRPNEGTNPTVINYNGKIIINGGTITSETDRAVLQYTGGGTIEINGTNDTTIIEGARGAGCDTGNMIITGGKITGRTGHGAFTNGGTITIGKNDSSVDTKTPDITGTEYGLNVGSGSAYFYDGVIKGPKMGKSVSNIFTGIQSGYGLKRVITDTSETLTLSNKNFQNTTSNAYYGTLADAFDNSATGTTIKVLNDTFQMSNSNMASGKTLTLDLNGRRITHRSSGVINKGKLTVTGTSGIINSNQNTIKNGESEADSGAELIINGGGTVSGESSGSSSINNWGKLTISGGTISSTNYKAIYNQVSGKVTISGGTITAKNYTIHNYGTANTSSSPAVKITGGTLKSTGAVTICNDSTGYIYLTGGTISQAAANSATYNKSTGTIHLAGATINHSATAGSGMANASTGKVIATSGTITSSKTIGIENLSTGTITIGTNETTPSVSTTVPSITGATKGVNNPSGKLYYYDGVIKATNGTAISGTVTGKPTGYNVKTTTSGTAQTSILALSTSTSSTSSTFSLRPSVVQQEQTGGDNQTEQEEQVEQTENPEEVIDVQVEEEKNVQIGNNTYETINKAIESANNGDTIKILENIEITEKVEIPENKEIKIDLNNKTITSNLVNTIENKGTLTITSMGIIRNEVDNGTVILNNGVLNIENGIITNATNGGKGIYNEGTVNISGGKIVTEGIGTNCIYNAKNSKLNMNAGIIETIGFGSKGIYNNSEVEILKNEDEEIIPNIVVSADDCIGIYNSEDATVCNIMSAEITIEAEEIENYEEIKNTDEFKAELEEMKLSYGIYNNAEIDVNLEEVVIKVERLKGIGIYNNSAGSIVLGKLDDVVNVATPIIYAIADNTTAIVNVDTESGKIKFYDGTLSTLVSIKSIITDILENYEIFESIGENVINTILKEILINDGTSQE
ncbi:MAG: hypothetical protein E7313_02485 [Clostridiales bacterium]|nr:hypothetical protein [Clostridiales bacterium]